jgi:pilus assembly protein CpaB
MEALRKPTVVFALALFFALLATAFAYMYLKRQPRVAQVPQVNATVLVASKEIRAGTVIERELVAMRSFPPSSVPANVLRYPYQATGRVAAKPLAAGEFITTDAVVPRSLALGPAYVLPASMRAVTVLADAVSGIAGFLKAGDRVDILATFTRGDDAVTRVILQDVEVLAVGNQVQPSSATDSAAARTVASSSGRVPITLAVTVPEAQRLVMADTAAKIRLMLRPATGGSYVFTGGVTESGVSGVRLARATGSSRPASAPAATRPKASPLSRQLARAYGSVSGGGPSLWSLPPQLAPVRAGSATAPRTLPPVYTITVIRGTRVEHVTVPESPLDSPSPEETASVSRPAAAFTPVDKAQP